MLVLALALGSIVQGMNGLLPLPGVQLGLDTRSDRLRVGCAFALRIQKIDRRCTQFAITCLLAGVLSIAGWLGQERGFPGLRRCTAQRSSRLYSTSLVAGR